MRRRDEVSTLNMMTFRDSRAAHKFIGVLGRSATLESEGSAASILRRMGASIRTLDLSQSPLHLLRDRDRPENQPLAIVFEAIDRADLAAPALEALRREPHFDNVGTLLAVTVAQFASAPPSSGFDDLVRYPYSAEELYFRVRAVEWRYANLAPQAPRKLGRLVVDRPAHEVSVDGRRISLTPKEFTLLAYLCEQHGKALTREHLLDQVWGHRYRGNVRTVDVHVSRLRAKLGEAFAVEPLRGTGAYRLVIPDEAAESPTTAMSEDDTATAVRPSRRRTRR